MAALQAQVLAPQAIVDPRRIAMYAQWYSDANNAPFAEGYAPVLQAFAAGVGFNIAPHHSLGASHWKCARATSIFDSHPHHSR